MRVAILGYGAIAGEHARALTRLGCTLAAVTGPRLHQAEVFARAHGVARVAPTVEDAISADDSDAIVVASPSDVHAEQAVEALKSGKHVLCEVPLGLSLDEAQRVAHEGRRGPYIMVCHTQRFLEPFQVIRDWSSKDIVHHVVIRLVLNRTTNTGLTGRARSWTDHLVWHHGAHAVDSALWLIQPPTAEALVRAIGVGKNAAGSPMDVGILLGTENAVATIALSYRAARPKTDLQVICESDTYRYENGCLSSRRYGTQRFNGMRAFSEAVEQQDALFVNSIANDVSPSPSPQELLPVYDTLRRVMSEIEIRGEVEPRG